MKEEFSRVYFAWEVHALEKERMPKGDLERITKNQLSRGISDFIVKELDKLPATIQERHIFETDSIEIRISLNLISDEEYRRLKEIEREYNRINYR